MSCEFLLFFLYRQSNPRNEGATKLITFVERKCLNDNLFRELTTNCSAFSLFMPQSSQGCANRSIKNMTASVFSFSMKPSLQTYVQSLFTIQSKYSFTNIIVQSLKMLSQLKTHHNRLSSLQKLPSVLGPVNPNYCCSKREIQYVSLTG